MGGRLSLASSGDGARHGDGARRGDGARSDDAKRDAPKRTRRPWGSLRLPEDLVCSVLEWNDLRGRFACVVACSKFRDAQARLSPGFERSLVVGRFPLLATVLDDSCSTPPKQLFLSQKRLFESRGPFPSVAATVGLNTYTFSLEINLHRRVPGTPGTPGTPALETDHQTVYVGTGSPCGSETLGGLEFELPAGLWQRADDYMSVHHHHSCKARLMVTRRKSGVIERAQLFQGEVDDGDSACMIFEYYDVPRKRDSAALNWSLSKLIDLDMYADPMVNIHWSVPSRDARAGPSTVEARFMLMTPNDSDQMSLEDTSLVLEHYVDWTPL